MTTKTISLEVDADVAAAVFSTSSAKERRKLELLVNLRLRELTVQRARPLHEIMDEIGREAESRGVTPQGTGTIALQGMTCESPMSSQETNPYFPPRHFPDKPQSALPSTRRQLIWRCAKLGGKLGFYIVGGLTFLLWIGLLMLAAYKTARNGASLLEELAKKTEGRTLEYLGLSLFQVIFVTMLCGFFGAIVGGLGSLFRRNLRSDDSEIAK